MAPPAVRGPRGRFWQRGARDAAYRLGRRRAWFRSGRPPVKASGGMTRKPS